MAKIVKFADGKYGLRQFSIFDDHKFLEVENHGDFPVWKTVYSNHDVPENCKTWSVERIERALKARNAWMDDIHSSKDHGTPVNGFFQKIKSIFKILRWKDA